MKFFLLPLTLCVSTLSYGQNIHTVPDSCISLGSKVVETNIRAMATHQYKSRVSNKQVDVVWWDGASAGFFWQREENGQVLSGTKSASTSTPARNADIVIGSNGNAILVAYQILATIDVQLFVWDGLDYVLDVGYPKTVTVNSTPQGFYIYGGPNLAIDKFDNVVLTYNSYDNPPGDISPTKEFFVRAGTLMGGFAPMTGDFNAFRPNQAANLGMTHADRLDVDMFVTDQNNSIVFFAGCYKTDSTIVLDQFSIPFTDLLMQNDSSFKRLNLQTQPDTSYRMTRPSIAANPDSSHPQSLFPGDPGYNSNDDEWVIVGQEKDLVAQTNNMVLYKGVFDNGGVNNKYNRVVLSTGVLGVCPHQLPDVSYFNDSIYASWTFVNCLDSSSTAMLSGASLDGQDVMGATVDANQGNLGAIFRFNDDLNLSGDQVRPSLSAAYDSDELLLGYYNFQKQEVMYKKVHRQRNFSIPEQYPTAMRLSLFPNPSRDIVNVVVNNPQKVGGEIHISIFDALGKQLLTRVFTLNGAAEAAVLLDVQFLDAGVYTVRLNTSAGSSSTSLLKL